METELDQLQMKALRRGSRLMKLIRRSQSEQTHTMKTKYNRKRAKKNLTNK